MLVSPSSGRTWRKLCDKNTILLSPYLRSTHTTRGYSPPHELLEWSIQAACVSPIVFDEVRKSWSSVSNRVSNATLVAGCTIDTPEAGPLVFSEVWSRRRCWVSLRFLSATRAGDSLGLAQIGHGFVACQLKVFDSAVCEVEGRICRWPARPGLLCHSLCEIPGCTTESFVQICWYLFKPVFRLWWAVFRLCRSPVVFFCSGSGGRRQMVLYGGYVRGPSEGRKSLGTWSGLSRPKTEGNGRFKHIL